jgi:molecular chaperone DnaK
MVKEAEEHAEDDKKRRELVEARNQAEALIHQTEKTLSEAGDKVDAADKAAAEEKIAALKQAAEGEDVAAIQAASQALAEVAMKVGEALYKDTEGAGNGAESPGGDAGEEAASEDKVVDADFEEVDDDSKSKEA